MRGEAWHCDDYAALCVSPLYHSSARPLAPLTFLVYDTRKKSVKGATTSRNSRLVWRPQRLIKRQRRWPAVDHYPRQSDNVEAAPQLAWIVLSLGWAAAAAATPRSVENVFFFFVVILHFIFISLIASSRRLSIIYCAQFFIYFRILFLKWKMCFRVSPLVIAIDENA